LRLTDPAEATMGILETLFPGPVLQVPLALAAALLIGADGLRVPGSTVIRALVLSGVLVLGWVGYGALTEARSPQLLEVALLLFMAAVGLAPTAGALVAARRLGWQWAGRALVAGFVALVGVFSAPILMVIAACATGPECL
jgi:hypothetical protein